MEERIVVYPAPGMGHMVPLVELGKRLVTNRHSLSITVITTTLPFDYTSAATSAYIASVSAAFPSITFLSFPAIPTLRHPSSYPNTEDILFELIPNNNPNLRKTLISLSLTSKISAFVIDFFCASALDVGKSLSIPTYFFFISGASALGLFLNFPEIDRNTSQDGFPDSFSIAGLPTIPAAALPDSMLDRGETYREFVNVGFQMARSDGVVVNSFEGFEPRAVICLNEGVCVPEGSRTPPVFCVGPLISAAKAEVMQHESLTWLDEQPSRSVVFVCFGSSAIFSKEQLGEIAVGLERSGVRFLWVVRDPPPLDDISKRFTKPPEPDLDKVLPVGFLGRTEGRGLVVKSWAPQTAILAHEAVGAFVTHCGWNSTLEAVCAGVPLIAWPLFAEQRFNSVVLVDEVRVALPMKETKGATRLVSAEEIERRVREMMESDEGKAIRQQMLEMKYKAQVAISEEGSSTDALTKFIEAWRN